MPLGDEFEIIRTIKRTLGKPSKRVILGIGDDGAVLKEIGERDVSFDAK